MAYFFTLISSLWFSIPLINLIFSWYSWFGIWKLILPSLVLCSLILLVHLETNPSLFGIVFLDICIPSHSALVTSDVAIKVVGNDAYVRWLGHIWFNMVLLNWHYWSFFSWCSWFDILILFLWCSWIDILILFFVVLLNWHYWSFFFVVLLIWHNDSFFRGALDLVFGD